MTAVNHLPTCKFADTSIAEATIYALERKSERIDEQIAPSDLAKA